MADLSSLPNISKVIEGKLIEAGISTVEQFMQLGSRGAFLRIRRIDPTACINMLYGLEGAAEGIRWHGLPDHTKEDLKRFFHSLNGA